MLTIIRCGHPLPLLAQGQAVHAMHTQPSLPLCLGTEAGSDDLRRLAPGSRALFFSDGAFEGRGAQGDYLDLRPSFARRVGGILDDVVLLIAEQSIHPHPEPA